MRTWELYSEILKHLREEDYYSILADFVSYHRIQGTPEMDEAMYFLRDILKSYDIRVVHGEKSLIPQKRVFGFPFFKGWRPLSLKAFIKYGKDIIDFDFNLNPFSFVQRSGNIKGRYSVVLDGSGTRKDRFVLVSNLRKGIVKYLASEDARGLLLYDPLSPKEVRKKFQFWYHDKKDREFAGVVLTGIEAQKIKSYIEHKGKVFLDIYAESVFYEPLNHYLLAKIDGEDRRAILFVAHTCHARGEANDNGSGVSSLVYAAITMQSMISKGVLKKPPYTVYFLLVPEMWGTAMFIEEERNILENIFAGFNFDMVGSNLQKTGGEVIIERPHGAMKTNIHHVFKKYVEDVQRFLDFPYAVFVRPFDGGSDHLLFQDVNMKIPMPMLIHWPDKYYHSDMDVISNIDPKAIWRNVILIISMPYLLGREKVVAQKKEDRKTSGKSTYEVLKRGVYIPVFDEDFEIRKKWYNILMKKEGYVNFAQFFYYIDGKRSFMDIINRIKRDIGKKPDIKVYNEYLSYLKERGVVKEKTIQ